MPRRIGVSRNPPVLFQNKPGIFLSDMAKSPGKIVTAGNNIFKRNGGFEHIGLIDGEQRIDIFQTGRTQAAIHAASLRVEVNSKTAARDGRAPETALRTCPGTDRQTGRRLLFPETAVSTKFYKSELAGHVFFL